MGGADTGGTFVVVNVPRRAGLVKLGGRNREIDQLVLGSDAGVGGLEVVGAQGNHVFRIIEGLDFGAVGIDETEELADDVARDERLMVGESGIVGIMWAEGIAKDGVLLLDCLPVGFGDIVHFMEELFSASTSKERRATAEVTGEAERPEMEGEPVALREGFIDMEDFCVGKTEVEVAEMVAVSVGEMVGVGEDIGRSDSVGVGENGARRGVVAKVVATGKMVDGEADECGESHDTKYQDA